MRVGRTRYTDTEADARIAIHAAIAAAHHTKTTSVADLTDLDVGEGRITILPWDYDSIGQGTWVLTLIASQILNGWLNNDSNADGDNISYRLYLTAGTYTLRVVGRKHTICGIVDVDIDAVEVASFDLYGALTYNVVFSQTGITIASDGLKTLKLRVDGKNASSSAYYASISAIALWRTA